MGSSRSVTNWLKVFWCLLSFLWTASVNCLPLDSESECIVTTSFAGQNPGQTGTVIHRLSTNNTQQACKLNVQSILTQRPTGSHTNKMFMVTNPAIFIFLLTCSTSLQVNFYMPKRFPYFRNIQSPILIVSGVCEISIKNLAVAMNPKSLALVDGVYVREESINQTVFPNMFTNLMSLHLRSLSRKGIPNMFTNYTWNKMVDLHLVNISLTSIPDALKKAMPNVITLEISHNHLTNLSNVPWCLNSVNLTVEFNPGLDLNECKLPPLDLESRVSLRGNGLLKINPDIFNKVKTLQVIDLSQNKLEDIPAQIFKNNTVLRDINLANNNFQFFALGTFQELRQLRTVDLSNNNIHTLQNGLLSGSVNLEEIYLQNNSLKQIEPAALPFGENSLKRIHLQANKLSSIPMAAFYESKLEVFDISDNMVDHRRFIETLTSLDFSTFANSHFNRGTKKIFKIQRNKIEHLFGTYLNATMLSKLGRILTIFTLDIKDNPLICDCTMMDFQRKIQRLVASDEKIDESQFDSWLCHSPDDVRGKKLLSIRPKHLKCEIHYKCPTPCKCYKRLSGLPSLVDCRSVGLRKLPNDIPDGPVELRLEHNEIRHLNFPSHNYLRNVTSLHLSNNSLQEITLSSFLPLEMKEIYLDSNRLTALPKDFEKFNLSNINIQNNVFKCDCNNKWMKTWLRELGNALEGGESGVLCSSGKKLWKTSALCSRCGLRMLDCPPNKQNKLDYPSHWFHNRSMYSSGTVQYINFGGRCVPLKNGVKTSTLHSLQLASI